MANIWHVQLATKNTNPLQFIAMNVINLNISSSNDVMLNKQKGFPMKTTIKISALTASLIMCGAVNSATITLDGQHLSIEDAWKIANGQADVAISDKSMDKLVKSHELVLTAARQGQPVYGLTVGVGLNKDKKLFHANGELTEEAKKASREFNYNVIRADLAGSGPSIPKNLVRLSMVLRLNTLLNGQSGAQPRVATLYKDFLNKGITPVIPSEGSIGEGDILLAAHVGAVMYGEWRAEYKGKILSGKEVLKATGITPLVPEGKDGLAILSNNSVATAYAMDAAKSARKILEVTPAVFGMSLEGLNGNITPFLPQTVGAHPFEGLLDTAKVMRDALRGSYLWNTHPSRALQDPLSFRVTVYGLNEARRELNNLEKSILVQINSSDDNPATLLNASEEYRDFSQVNRFFIDDPKVKGAIIPSANFNPLPIALAAQGLSQAMVHLSHYSVQRTLHLSEDQFTGLSRFLSAKGNNGHAFGAIQKAFMGLHVDNMSYANPVSFLGLPVAGNIEDTTTNLLQASQRLKKISENMSVIYSLEMLHSTQAIDLRKETDKTVKLSELTGNLYSQYRKLVPFVERDRAYTDDIAKGAELVKKF